MEETISVSVHLFSCTTFLFSCIVGNMAYYERLNYTFIFSPCRLTFYVAKLPQNEQESIQLGCLPSACQPYAVVLREVGGWLVLPGGTCSPSW